MTKYLKNEPFSVGPTSGLDYDDQEKRWKDTGLVGPTRRETRICVNCDCVYYVDESKDAEYCKECVTKLDLVPVGVDT